MCGEEEKNRRTFLEDAEAHWRRDGANGRT